MDGAWLAMHNPWVSMDPPWVSMDYPWVSTSMGSHAYPWIIEVGSDIFFELSDNSGRLSHMLLVGWPDGDKRGKWLVVGRQDIGVKACIYVVEGKQRETQENAGRD